MASRQKSPFPELDEIIAVVRADKRQDLVILIIPSHDRRERELSNQEWWAGAAMELFADLYGGATAFKTFAGIYRTDTGKVLHDQPIMIESYVQREDLENRDKLAALLKFAKRLGRETSQAAVGLVVNSVFHEITDFTAK
ncbi:MAG: hypothetical protein HYS13_02510 [Planctomycetia bacterium]|nr:hypothetical protein [Planctomycetia bacterium]